MPARICAGKKGKGNHSKVATSWSNVECRKFKACESISRCNNIWFTAGWNTIGTGQNGVQIKVRNVRHLNTARKLLEVKAFRAKVNTFLNHVTYWTQLLQESNNQKQGLSRYSTWWQQIGWLSHWSIRNCWQIFIEKVKQTFPSNWPKTSPYRSHLPSQFSPN